MLLNIIDNFEDIFSKIQQYQRLTIFPVKLRDINDAQGAPHSPHDEYEETYPPGESASPYI